MISPLQANLISVLVECILYGLYIPLFFGTGLVLLKRRAQDGGRLNIVFTAVTVLLFLLATLHFAGSIRLVFESFTFPAAAGQFSAIEDHAHPLNQYRKAIDTIAIFIGDGLVMYRCYTIWKRDLRVIMLPIVLLILTTVAGRVCAFLFTKPGLNALRDPDLQTWISIFFGSSFATNLIVTSLSIYRLVKDGRKTVPSGASNPSRRVIGIIIESAALYLLGTFFVLILFASHSPAVAIPVNILAALIGIAPTLIILQAQSGLSPALPPATGDSHDDSYDSAMGQSMAHTLPVYHTKSERSAIVTLPPQSFASMIGGPSTPPATFKTVHPGFLAQNDGFYPGSRHYPAY